MGRYRCERKLKWERERLEVREMRVGASQRRLDRPGPADADSEMFGEMLWSNAALIHAYLSRRCPGAADDLLSEVLVSAYAGRHGFDAERGTLRAWLYGIARNTLADYLRAERSRGSRLPDMELRSVDDWAEVDARLDAARMMPSHRELLGTIPKEEREVLLLVAWEDLSPTEAAQVLSIPAGTARSRLHRARRRLACDSEQAGLSTTD